MNIFKLKQFYIAPISSMDFKDLCRSRYAPFLEIKLFRIDAQSHMAGRHLRSPVFFQ